MDWSNSANGQEDNKRCDNQYVFTFSSFIYGFHNQKEQNYFSWYAGTHAIVSPVPYLNKRASKEKKECNIKQWILFFIFINGNDVNPNFKKYK